MVYGKTKRGTQLHMMVEGKALCGMRGVEATEQQPDMRTDSRACANCDNELRERGRFNAPPPPKPNPRAFYTPRFTFEDHWARGLTR